MTAYEIARMTMRVYTVHPDGSQSPGPTRIVRETDPLSPLANPVAWPPCECPAHRAEVMRR
jgi:hypothetical protein